MLKDMSGSDWSELEQEFELEMDDLEVDQEFEADDEFEAFESESESGKSDEFDLEFELEDSEGDYEFEESQDEFESSDTVSELAERFYELSQQEFESEADMDQPLNELMRELEREFFFGGIKKRWNRLKKKGLGKLLQKGLKLASGRIPQLKILQSLTDLSKGNLTGLLKNAAKMALSAHPAGAAALPALSALGFETSPEFGEPDREAWDNYVGMAKEAYEYLAENLTPNADHPLEASRLATVAFQKAVQNSKGQLSSRMPALGRRPKGRTRVIRVGPGQRLAVHLSRGGKVLVRGR
jgi:hypothetical protein